MVQWQDVINLAVGDAAALAAFPPDSQGAILAAAQQFVNPVVWGTYNDLAVTYLSAHLAKLALMKGTGPITAEKVGEMSRSYGTIQGLKGTYGITSYGATFYSLLRQRAPRFLVT